MGKTERKGQKTLSTRLQAQHHLQAGKPDWRARMKPGNIGLPKPRQHKSNSATFGMVIATSLQSSFLRDRPICCPKRRKKRTSAAAAEIPMAFNRRSGRVVHISLVFAVSSMLMLISFTAFPADWVPLGTDARGNAWHIDMASIAKEHDTVMAWKHIEFTHAHPPLLNGTLVKKAFLLGAMDCAQRRAGVKAMRLLNSEGSIVAVYEQGKNNSLQWPPGAHAALLERAMSMVCGGTESSLH